MQSDEPLRAPGSHAHRWLLAIPFIWQVALVPFVNDIAWRPFSLPFPMAWQMAGVIVTTLVIGAVFAIDRRREPEPDAEPDADGGAVH